VGARARILGIVTLVVGFGAACVLPPGTAVAKHTRPEIIVYGDSLAWEAQDFITFFLHVGKGADVSVKTFPGTAICDWLDAMRTDALNRPAAVIVAFSGAALTPCMKDPSTGHPMVGPAVVDKYRADSQTVLSTFGAATKVWFVGYPISRAADAAPDGQALRTMYQSLPQTNPTARWVDAGVLIVTSTGHYTDTLPCLAFEPCQPDGISIVRAPDGGHFCPIPHNDGRYQCSMWSSGAFRYGLSMTLPVVRDLGLVR
jgi:hypothetical protein